MNIRQLEKASFDSWPALQDVAINGGVLRYANGVSKRANSLVLNCEQLPHPSALIDRAEQFYRSKNRSVIVRICAQQVSIPNAKPCTHLILDAELATCGYEVIDETAVMVRSSNENENSEITLQNQAEEVSVMEWLKGHYVLKNLPEVDFEIHFLMLKKLKIPSSFMVVRDDDSEIIATGFATLSGCAVGIYGLATHVNYQRQGVATGLLKSLEKWGQRFNAKMLYLQVESSNAAALGLYQKLGFTKKTNYWYRISR